MKLLRSLGMPLCLVMAACGGDSFSAGATGTGGAAGTATGSGGAAGTAGGAQAGAGAAGVGGGAAGASGGQGGGGQGGGGQGGVAGAGGAGTSGGGQGGTAAGGAGSGGVGGASAGSGGVAGNPAGQGGVSGAGAGGAGAGGAGAGGAGAGGAGAGGAGAGGAGTGGAGAGGAGAGGAGAGGAGAGGAGGSPTTIYVSDSTGHDVNFDGLTPTTPKRTIGAGIAAASQRGLPTVKICNGAYSMMTKIIVPQGVSLLGGYDCATFTVRSSYTKEALCEGLVDDANLTTIDTVAPITIEGGDPAGTTVLSQLDVTSAKLAIFANGTSPVIEENRIRIRQESQQEETTAVRITGGKAQVRQNCLRGGDGKAAAAGAQVGSSALMLDAGTTAAVTKNIVFGGKGQGATDGYGSIGIYVTGATPTVSDNVIDGGSGTSSTPNRVASVGLYAVSTVTGQTLAPLFQRNTITGGDGAHTLNNGGGSTGVVLSAAQGAPFSPKVLDNVIDGGRGTNVPGVSSGNSGLSIYQVNIELTGNTITGGTFAGSSFQGGAIGVNMVSSTGKVQRNSILGANGNYKQSIGLVLAGAPQTLVDNNMIHGGLQTAPSPDASQAVLLGNASANLLLRHNTIILGPDAATSYGVNLTGSLSTNDPSMRFENNLVVGSDKAGRVGFRFETCPDGQLASFAGNGLANLDDHAVELPSAAVFAACVLAAPPANLDTFQPGLATLCTGKPCAGKVVGNVHLRDTCGASSTCGSLPTCFTQQECGEALFQQWSADSGVSTLLGVDGGWRLKESLLCPAQQSSYSAQLGTDRYSASRTAPASRGAHEQDVCAPM